MIEEEGGGEGEKEQKGQEKKKKKENEKKRENGKEQKEGEQEEGGEGLVMLSRHETLKCLSLLDGGPETNLGLSFHFFD